MSDVDRASPILVGRDSELAQIESAVDNVARRGSTVRIAGDPGVGKSALLRAGTELAKARGYTALSVRGTEGEAHLTFAALYQLLRPILGRIDELPAGHRAALMSAFGLVEPGPEPANRFFIALAALELIADAAAERPVFVGVDDLAWLDDASREAIEFISRRITDEQIVILTTCRRNQPPESTFGSQLLWLEALDTEDSRAVLHRQAPELSAVDEARVLEAAAGNPLALLELAKVAGRAAEPSVFGRIPLTQRLESSFAAGLDDVDPPVRMALLVAAIQDSDQLSETYAALGRLTEDRDARVDLLKAARLGMLIIEGDTFRFRHPLVRSAIAQSAFPEERRAVHQALEAALSADPDRAVWHRALAASRAEESLAAELDAGAARAAARGAPGLAEEWLRRAAELSEDDRHRGRRLLRAAELGFELGHRDSVSELLSEARTLTLDPSDYARLAGLEGAFDDGIPGDEDNISRLLAAADRARRDGAEDLAASLLLGACNSCYWGAAGERLRARVRAGIEALSLDRDDPRVMELCCEIDPFARGARLVGQLAQWVSREITDVALLGALARTGFIAGDFERGLVFATRASDLLRRQGRIALLTQTLAREKSPRSPARLPCPNLPHAAHKGWRVSIPNLYASSQATRAISHWPRYSAANAWTRRMRRRRATERSSTGFSSPGDWQRLATGARERHLTSSGTWSIAMTSPTNIPNARGLLTTWRNQPRCAAAPRKPWNRFGTSRNWPVTQQRLGSCVPSRTPEHSLPLRIRRKPGSRKPSRSKSTPQPGTAPESTWPTDPGYAGAGGSRSHAGHSCQHNRSLMPWEPLPGRRERCRNSLPPGSAPKNTSPMHGPSCRLRNCKSPSWPLRG